MDFGRVLEGSGVDFGEVWSPSVRLLDGSWALLGRSWALWAAPWRLLGRLLGALGRSGGLLGLILVPRNAPSLDFGGSGTCWARFWKAPGECFGMPFSAPRTSLRNALINAVTTLFHLPALLILPSGAAVCAQQMEFSAIFSEQPLLSLAPDWQSGPRM